MKIIFSDHALLKISERSLLQDKIVATIETPGLIRPSYGMREERYRRFGKNWLKVIVMIERGVCIIVTAHWVAKMKK